jgi:hypothetical protein
MQGGFECNAHRCLWQWRRGSVRLRWCQIRSGSRLADAGSIQLGTDQLLCSPGEAKCQAMFAELPWHPLKIAAITVALDDMVGY